MKRSIRPSTPDDAPAIAALFAELGMNPNVRAEDLHWKYWVSRPDWPGPRSYVLTSDGEIIAHGALIPGAILTTDNRTTTAHVIDWVARRGQGGAGVALMKHIGQQVDSLLAFGGSDDTLRILPHIGFRAAGTVTGYARPLFPLRILKSDVRIHWRLLPRLARNLFWKLMAARGERSAWRAARVSGATELARLARCLPGPVNGTTVLERSPELLGYMLDCTILRTALYTMEKGGEVGGYFMLAIAPGQVRIIDCWMSSQDPADWRAMINAAVAQARPDPEASEVVLWASNALQHAVVQSCGFRARFHLPMQIRVTGGTPVNSVGLNVQMLDNDAAYLHEGCRSLWI
jgi:hypothetical protein